MKQIRLLLAAAMLSMAAAVHADDYAYLDIQGDDGTTSYEVSAVSRITFSATSLVLHLRQGGSVELPLSQMERLAFSADGQTAIDAVAGRDDGITFSMEGGQLRVSGCEGRRLTVFTAGGRAVVSETCTTGDMLINLSGLRRGMYIVSVGRQTRKVMAP